MLSHLRRIALLGAAALLATGCDAADRPVEVAVARAERAPVVDSILPVDEALRRFRQDLPATDALRGGATERDSLVAAFAHALFAADTTTLATLLVERAEFAYLYYPESHFARAPYELDPAIVWFQVQNGTSRGITRALRRYGGSERGYRYTGHACEEAPTPLGEARLWEECVLHYVDRDGAPHTGRFFGSILEHGGRFKFVSYANPL